METPTPEPQPSQPKTILRAAETNEWGQITGLEAKAPYFVIRKPTPEFTRERSREMMEQARAFLHEHRVLTEQQMKELSEKYGEPAKARVNELRTVLEKRFDEISKEIEQRVAKLTADKPSATGAGETPGEMPTGSGGMGASMNASANAASSGFDGAKKRGAKKSE